MGQRRSRRGRHTTHDSFQFRNLSIDNAPGAEHKLEGKQQVFQLMQMCERNIHFRSMLFATRILDLVQDLMGPNIMLFHDQTLYKPAKTGGAVFWHQDNAHWRCRPSNLISCWMTLDDVERENGAMQFVPGSHLKPAWHERSEETNALLKTEGVDESKVVVVDLPAGGVVFHHCQTLHYTQPNATDRKRRAFAIHFMPPGTRKDGDVMQVNFNRPLLRMNM